MNLPVSQTLKAGATLITANPRLARLLRQEYDALQQAEGLRAWEAPDIVSLHAWLERCWREWLYAGGSEHPLLSLRPSQEQALWEGIIEESPHSEYLLQIPATAASALEAWNLLHSWKLDPAAADWQGSQDTAAFLDWSTRFRQRSEEEGWLPGALLPDFLAQRFAGGGLRVPRHVLLAGFDEFTPQQQSLIDALRGCGSTVESLEPTPDSQRGRAVRVGFSDSEAEMLAAARWTRALLDRGASGPIGIVAPDLSGLRSRLERIFSEVLHPGAALPGRARRHRAFNISLGPSLLAYPLIHTAFLLLELDGLRLPLATVGALLRSPFLAGAEGECSQRARLDARLRKHHELEVPLRTALPLARHSCPIFARRLARWRKQRKRTPAHQLLSAWAAGFAGLLRAAGWPGDRPLDSVEYQTLTAWNDLLSEFSALDLGRGPIGFQEAVASLGRLAAARVFQPESEQAPVEILGVLEASGRRFEQLWVMGLDDSVWPRAPRPNPFLPVALQRRHNLPHSSPAREFEFAQMLTQRLLASAREIVFSYPKRQEDYDLRPSPLIESVPEISAKQLGLPPSGAYADLLQGSAALEELRDDPAPGLAARQWQRGGTDIFTHQAACPFRAFARLRLGAQPLESAQPGLAPPERGSLLHAALRLVWNELGSGGRLCAVPPDELEEVVRRAIEQALDPAKYPALLHARLAALEQARLHRLILEWLAHEKTRAPFTVLDQERSRQVSVGGLEFEIRADRIDRLADGRHVLIDYKSGEHFVREWGGERPDEPQLPLYAVTSGLDLAGVAFAQLKTGKLRFRGWARDEGVLPGAKQVPWEEQMQAWRRVIERLAGEFLAGRAPVAPKDAPKTCEYCGLAALCRIHEQRRPVGDDSEEAPYE
jgi:probable DNA repair protein